MSLGNHRSKLSRGVNLSERCSVLIRVKGGCYGGEGVEGKMVSFEVVIVITIMIRYQWFTVTKITVDFLLCRHGDWLHILFHDVALLRIKHYLFDCY